MKQKLRQWLRNFLGVEEDLATMDKSFSVNVQILRRRIEAAEQLIKDRTTLAADVGYSRHHENWIIVIGRYKNRDYVQAFGAPSGEFESLCRQLKEMERYGTLDKVDAPPQFRAVYETFK